MSRAERRAKVNGSPHGTIAWSEHEKAWAVYALRHSGQSAERINQRGGFGIEELTHQLGHLPLTWEPDERTRFMDGAAPRGMAAALAAAGIGDAAEAQSEAAGWRERAMEADASTPEALRLARIEGAQAVLDAVEAVAVEFGRLGDEANTQAALKRANGVRDSDRANVWWRARNKVRTAAREAARNAGGGAS